MFALEHVHRTLDVGRDINVVIVFEQSAQSVARMLLVINDQDGGLDRIHESVSGRRCAIYSHSITPSLNHEDGAGKFRIGVPLNATAAFRDKAPPLDRAESCH